MRLVDHLHLAARLDLRQRVDAGAPRTREIEAAIAAYNDADPETLLPPDAARLLSVMFRRSSVCLRTHLAAEASETMRLVKRLLRILLEVGFLFEAAAACRAGRLESRFTGRCEAPAPHYGILIGQTCMLPAGGLRL